MKTEIETKAIELFNNKFGTDKLSRFRKVTEEYLETSEALNIYFEIPQFGRAKENEEYLKDEISDLFATVTHFASLFDLSHADMLEMALDKVAKREIDKNYKRFRN
jgi:NTP pyrophosphatase (non-canonical NTP hydrolase)